MSAWREGVRWGMVLALLGMWGCKKSPPPTAKRQLQPKATRATRPHPRRPIGEKKEGLRRLLQRAKDRASFRQWPKGQLIQGNLQWRVDAQIVLDGQLWIAAQAGRWRFQRSEGGHFEGHKKRVVLPKQGPNVRAQLRRVQRALQLLSVPWMLGKSVKSTLLGMRTIDGYTCQELWQRPYSWPGLQSATPRLLLLDPKDQRWRGIVWFGEATQPAAAKTKGQGQAQKIRARPLPRLDGQTVVEERGLISKLVTHQFVGSVWFPKRWVEMPWSASQGADGKVRGEVQWTGLHFVPYRRAGFQLR